MSKKEPPLPGLEEPAIEEIEDAAETVGDLCDKRMKLQKEEGEARKVLAAVLKSNKRRVYRMRDGRVAELEVITEEKARVRKPKAKREKKKGKGKL